MFLSTGILDRGQSGIAEIVAKCVVRYEVSPDCLGHRILKKTRQMTDDDDRPEEFIEEPSPDQLLPGIVTADNFTKHKRKHKSKIIML